MGRGRPRSGACPPHGSETGACDHSFTHRVSAPCSAHGAGSCAIIAARCRTDAEPTRPSQELSSTVPLPRSLGDMEPLFSTAFGSARSIPTAFLPIPLDYSCCRLTVEHAEQLSTYRRRRRAPPPSPHARTRAPCRTRPHSVACLRGSPLGALRRRGGPSLHLSRTTQARVRSCR